MKQVYDQQILHVKNKKCCLTCFCFLYMQVVGYKLIVCLSTAQKIHNIKGTLSFIKYVLYQKTFQITVLMRTIFC